MTKQKALSLIAEEMKTAIKKHPPMVSVHEGYAIILEEMDELWEEIKKKPSKRNINCLKEEAIQIGAMAARFLIDLT